MIPEITLDTRFDETGHVEPWRNELAHSLNVLLSQVKGEPFLVHATCSIVARVAQFEEIQIKP